MDGSASAQQSEPLPAWAASSQASRSSFTSCWWGCSPLRYFYLGEDFPPMPSEKDQATRHAGTKRGQPNGGQTAGCFSLASLSSPWHLQRVLPWTGFRL